MTRDFRTRSTADGPIPGKKWEVALPALLVSRVVDFVCKINSLHILVTSGCPHVPPGKSVLLQAETQKKKLPVSWFAKTSANMGAEGTPRGSESLLVASAGTKAFAPASM